LSSFHSLSQVWNKVETNIEWWAPGGLYWIYERPIYTRLPQYWAGTCVFGTIHPSFILLPLPQGEQQGIPVYEGTQGVGGLYKGVDKLETGKMVNGPQSA
jgi:hypothetical protein